MTEQDLRTQQDLRTVSSEEILALKPGTDTDTLVARFRSAIQGRPVPCAAVSTELGAATALFLDGMILTGNASIDADMEDYRPDTLPEGAACGDVWVRIGGTTVMGPLPIATCQAFLLAVQDVWEEDALNTPAAA